MNKLATLSRVAIVVLVMGLLAQMSDMGGASWAAPGQDVERETVPTRTPTPGPPTPTVPPPPATDTPPPPPPATVTPAPITPTVTQPAGAANPAPSTLPGAGSGPSLLWGGLLLLANGALLWLAGSRARRRGR
jgi:type IV secretory pathway VirB10-like protein